MKLSTETKVYAFFVTAFAGVVILGFMTYRSTRELIVNDRWVAHTHQVRQSIADLESAGFAVEYLEIRDADTLAPVAQTRHFPLGTRPARILSTARRPGSAALRRRAIKRAVSAGAGWCRRP